MAAGPVQSSGEAMNRVLKAPSTVVSTSGLTHLSMLPPHFDRTGDEKDGTDGLPTMDPSAAAEATGEHALRLHITYKSSIMTSTHALGFGVCSSLQEGRHHDRALAGTNTFCHNTPAAAVPKTERAFGPFPKTIRNITDSRRRLWPGLTLSSRYPWSMVVIISHRSSSRDTSQLSYPSFSENCLHYGRSHADESWVC